MTTMKSDERLESYDSRRAMELSYDASQEVREDGDKRYLRFIAATDIPLIRNMYFGTVRETLDFSGLDTARLSSGRMNLLDTHNSGSIDAILGRISAYEIKERQAGSRKEKLLEVEAEFDMTRARSKEAFDGIMSRAISGVSLGYAEVGVSGMVVDWLDERSDYDPERDPVGEITYKRWEATEVSLCPVQADRECFVGRTASSRIEIAYKKHLELRNKQSASANITPNSKQTEQRSEEVMTDKTENTEAVGQAIEPAGENARDIPAVEEKPVEAARKFDASGQSYLAAEAISLAAKGVDEEFVRTLAERASKGDGISEAAVKSAIFDHIQERDTKQMKDITQRAPAIAKPDAEYNKFSAARLLKCAAEGRTDGIERELVRDWEIEKFGNRSPNGPAEINSDRGTNLPFSLLLQDEAIRSVLLDEYLISDKPKVRAMREKLLQARSNPYTVGTTNAGYHQVEYNEMFFIEALIAQAMTLGYTNMWAMELAQDYSGIIETNSMSTQDVNPSAETSARTASTGPSYAAHTLKWHELYGRLTASQRTFDQSRMFAQRLLYVMNRDLMRGVNDRLLNGLTASHQPLGLLAKTGSTTPVVTTTSNKLTWATLVGLREKVAAANGNINSNCVYVSTPEVESRILQTARFAGSTGGVSDAVLVNGMIDGFDFVRDNNAPKNLTAGNNRHGILFGDLSTVDYVSFSGVSLIRDDLTGLANGNVNFHIRYAYDLLPRNINHFAAAVDVNPAAV